MNSICRYGRVIEHEYDALGRRIKRLAPAGQTVEFTYNADSLLSRLETPRGSMEFEYDKAGRMTKRRMPGELEESFYHDRCRRIIEQSLHKPSRTLFHRGYKYDAEGNLIEMNDSNKGLSRFVYDPAERLREAPGPEREVERFVYDSTGNLLRRGEKEFRYGQPDRLTRTDDAALVYDEAGNLIEKRRAGAVIRYSYDADNRLIAVDSKEGGRIEFRYDALGRRIAKNTKDGETGFLWDGDTGLYYNFLRYYDPELGRYSTQDPIGLLGGFNPYGYSQNPLNLIDPLGLRKKKHEDSAFYSQEKRHTTIYEVV